MRRTPTSRLIKSENKFSHSKYFAKHPKSTPNRHGDHFYSTINKYGEFSNFSAHGVKLDGEWWPTTEHFFQAQKFEDAEYRLKIRTASTPKQSAELGRSRKMPLRPDWEAVKDEVMFRAVLAKFQTHPALKELLLATGDEEIVENAPGDSYWGIGKDGSGQNKLGRILVRVREELR